MPTDDKPENTGADSAGSAPANSDADLLTAINQAIDNEGAAPASSTDAKAEEAEASAGQTGDAAAKADAAADDTSSGDGQPLRDEKGRFLPRKKQDATAKPEDEAAKADGKPAAEEKADEKKAATGDPVNDPIPEDVRGRTRERMEALISRVKETTTQLEQIRTDHQDLLGMITETRATPEQFSQALGYLRAVNSGDPAQIKAAIQIVQAELTALARMIGEPVPGVDLLANHPDLRQKVENGDLSEQDAHELAAAREARALQQQRAKVSNEQQQIQAEIAQGRSALNQLEAELKASDPDYARKRAILVPTLQPVLRDLPPSKWAAAFKAAYDQLQLPPVAAPSVTATTATPAQQQQQPLRARQPAGPTARAPSSLLEAINAGIDQASSRR